MNPLKPIQDIATQKPTAGSSLLEPEFEHGIPVKHQETEQKNEQKNPINVSKQFVEEHPENDSDLEHILKDVNKNVKKEDSQNSHKHHFSFFRKSAIQPQEQEALAQTKSPKPMLAMVMAIILGCTLSVAAVYAFKSTKKTDTNNTVPAVQKVGTSADSSDSVQANGGALVQPGDLTDLSNSLQSKINGLNDTQDFNQNDLSDQNLGL